MNTPELLRTPEARFEGLHDYPFAPNYLEGFRALPGARLHYLDEGDPEAEHTFLCLHGAPTWSYLFRKMIPIFAEPGHRVLALDLLGCGKSDKLPAVADYSYTLHRKLLIEFVERLDLRNVTLVCQDWGGLLGLTLPMELPGRFERVLAMNTTLMPYLLRYNLMFRIWRMWAWLSPGIRPGYVVKLNEWRLTAQERAAYDAPYPDRRYTAGARAFPAHVPLQRVDDGADILQRAVTWWREDWDGDALLAIGTKDFALGRHTMLPLQRVIRNCPDPLLLRGVSHYVQERGEDVARRALAHFGLDRPVRADGRH